MSTIFMPPTEDTFALVEVDPPAFEHRARWKQGKAWAKAVESIDPVRRGGWAIQGRFISLGTRRLAVGTILLTYSESNLGSGGHPSWHSRACFERVTVDGLERLGWIEAPKGEWADQSLDLLTRVAQGLSSQEGDTR